MILVTGGAGYIGSHFIRRYLNTRPETDEIIAIDNLSTGHEGSLPNSKRVRFHRLDTSNSTAIENLLKDHKVTAVVHFAASCYVGESEHDPIKYLQNNVSKTVNLLDAMLKSNVNNFVFSSSCAVYGTPEFVPLTEEHDRKPISVYGQTKFMVEQILESLHRTSDLSYVALRYFNAAGAADDGLIGESHDPETHLIPNALKALAGQTEHLEIYGNDFETPDGTCIRDYIHVNDLADAHISALQLLEKGKCQEKINLGTGLGYSVKEIADTCSQIAGKELKIVIKDRRSGDPARLIANFEKAKSVLGWQPTYDLKRILETAWNWELNRKY